MMKIVVAEEELQEFHKEFETAIAGRAELVFGKRGGTEEEKARFEKEIADADVIVGIPSVNQLQAAKKLQWLQSTIAGSERYTADKNFPANVMLTNMTGAFGPTISEYIVAGILALYRRLFYYREQQMQANWAAAQTDYSLMGKRILILGAGDIGKETAKKLRAFHVASITGIRRTPREVPEEFDEMATLEELDTYLPQADIVIGCLPATPETIHSIDERRLRLMKKEAVFVNVGRGNLVDCDALARVIAEGNLGGAVLDVTDPEPLPKEHPLWQLEKVFITPHVSGKTFGVGAKQLTVKICCDNLARFLDGRKLRNVVDFESGYAKYELRGM